MEKEQEFQQKFYVYQMLKAQEEFLQKQFAAIIQTMDDLNVTEKTIEEMKNTKDDNILTSINSGAFAFSKIMDKKNVLVDIGAGVLVKKSLEDAKKLIGRRKEELNKTLNELNQNLAKTEEEFSKIEPEIQKLLQK